MIHIDSSPPQEFDNEFELQTRLGPADARVGMDGRLFVSWKGGVTLNKVRYIQANASGVDAGGPQGAAEITLTREDYRPGSAHACSLLLTEAMRHLQQVTPQRVAWAALVIAKRELHYTAGTLAQAREAFETAQTRHGLAVADLEQARATVARLGLEEADG